MKNFACFLMVFAILFMLPRNVKAATSYGSGVYTNLCGSGTLANKYTCDNGCDPKTGSCASTVGKIVKYVCVGRFEQCFENESYWSNQQLVDGQGCGKTVQLSMYDKTCRLDDGSWDSSCKLLGYMVWYSGVCSVGENSLPIPTKPIASPTIVFEAFSTPTPTLFSRFSSPTPSEILTTAATGGSRVCNVGCVDDTQCRAGFACINSVCRNPSCQSDKTCFCGAVVATGSAKPKTPETGGEWWIVIVVAGLFGAGVFVRKYSRRFQA